MHHCFLQNSLNSVNVFTVSVKAEKLDWCDEREDVSSSMKTVSLGKTIIVTINK